MTQFRSLSNAIVECRCLTPFLFSSFSPLTNSDAGAHRSSGKTENVNNTDWFATHIQSCHWSDEHGQQDLDDISLRQRCFHGLHLPDSWCSLIHRKS
jgi:hypothetical protein